MDTLLHKLDTFLRSFESGAGALGGTTADGSPIVTETTDQTGPASPFVNLPPHVALRVVPFLQHKDLQNSALVSHAWLRASNSTVRELRPRVFKPVTLCKRFGKLQELDLSRARGINDQTLEALGGLSCLKDLCLKRCREITDVGLKGLLDLSSMTRLSLARCPLVTGEGIGNLLGNMTQLCSLNIKHCYRITDDGLRGLSRLTSLTFLNCCSCRRITDSGMEFICSAITLRTLKASRCAGITDAGILSVGQLSNLVTLHLRMEDNPEQQQTDESIATISSALPSLTNLDVNLGDRVTLDGIQQLSQAKALKGLKLGRCHLICNQLVGHIASMSGLEALSLSEIHHLSDCGIIAIIKLRNLKSLSLRSQNDIDNSLTDTGLEALTQLKQLSELQLAAFLSVRGAMLYKLTSLTSLGINCCQEVGDASLQDISCLTNLQRLNFSGNRKVTDQTIGYLSNLTNLESLTLCDCHNITCSSATRLTDLSRLTVLTLSLCQSVSDSSLKAIASLASLVELNLGCCNHITDIGVAALGEGQLCKLRSVTIACCKNVTEEGTQKLQTRLPMLQRVEQKMLNHTLLHAIANSASRRAIV